MSSIKKLFRKHRPFLIDSLDTTIEVNGLSDLIKYCEKEIPYAKNVRIREDELIDNRLPAEWGNVTHYVVGDFEGYTGQCIGMCNFYEE